MGLVTRENSSVVGQIGPSCVYCTRLEREDGSQNRRLSRRGQLPAPPAGARIVTDSDRQLVERAVCGDRDAFGDLIERYRPLVHGVVLERVHNSEDAEDLVQESFVRAHQELSRLVDGKRFAVWLSVIAGNTVTDWWRRRTVQQRPDVTTEVASLYPPLRQPDEIAEESDTSAHLWRGIDKLAPELRKVLVLTYLEGCTQRQIAHFLGIPAATVHWRLFRARRKLGEELRELMVAGVRREPAEERRHRERISAVLPLMPLFRVAPQARRPRWLWPGLGLCGLAGVLGLVGTGIGLRISDIQAYAAGGATEPMRVWRTEWEMPEVSVMWDPSRPQPGERVRVVVAGPELEQAEKTVLHYLTDPDYPLDHVVPMYREGEEWVGELTIPSEAAVVFFYPRDSADGGNEPQRFDPTVGFETWQQWMQPYRWSFEVTDDSGSPVRGAAEGMATMARHQGEGEEVILQHLEREVRDYPDHFEVYSKIWYRQVTADRESEAVRERVFAEGAALRGRYPDSPEAWNVSASGFDPRRLALLRQLLRRFPEWERADEVFYMMSHSYRSTGDRAGEIRVLEEFLRGYPDSPYVDEAYRRLLALLARVDEDRAAGLADSLIDGTLVVEWSREREAQHRGLFLPNPGAMSPEGHAYSLRFDLHMAEGDTAAARNLAQRLLAADLVHPMPYLRVGSGLAGGATSGLPGGDPPASPEDLAVAESVLTAGRRRATVEDMLGLPSYLINANLPSHAREEYRILHTRQIERVRDSFATQIDRCRRLQRVGAGTGMAEVAR